MSNFHHVSVSLPTFTCDNADLISREGVNALHDVSSALPFLAELLEAYSLDAGRTITTNHAYGLAVLLSMLHEKLDAAQAGVYNLNSRNLTRFLAEEKEAEDA